MAGVGHFVPRFSLSVVEHPPSSVPLKQSDPVVFNPCNVSEKHRIKRIGFQNERPFVVFVFDRKFSKSYS